MIGSRTKVKVVKNKVAPPFQEAEFDIIYNKGISRAGEVLDLGERLGLVEKSGSFYAIDGERIGQGRERCVEWLVANPEKLEAMATKITTTPKREEPAPAEVAA